MGSYPVYDGIGRGELEQRLAQAEVELERLRTENTTLAILRLFTRWQCPTCSTVNLFASECVQCGRVVTQPDEIPHRLSDATRLKRVLQRVVAAHLSTSLGPMPNGTGGVHALAARERARSEQEGAALSGRQSWRQLASRVFAEALTEVQPQKLEPAIVRLAVVCTKWLERIDQEQCP
jgi:hypothetical protein